MPNYRDLSMQNSCFTIHFSLQLQASLAISFIGRTFAGVSINLGTKRDFLDSSKGPIKHHAIGGALVVIYVYRSSNSSTATTVCEPITSFVDSG